jgi:hypothetical protein
MNNNKLQMWDEIIDAIFEYFYAIQKNRKQRLQVENNVLQLPDESREMNLSVFVSLSSMYMSACNCKLIAKRQEHLPERKRKSR